jgi:hypothetical protein
VSWRQAEGRAGQVRSGKMRDREVGIEVRRANCSRGERIGEERE